MTASYRMPDVPLGIPAFTERALCAELGPKDSLWFADTRSPGAVQFARRLCSQCPAQRECLETALAAGPAVSGIWGGLTDRQRNKIRTQRSRLRRVAATFGPELGA